LREVTSGIGYVEWHTAGRIKNTSSATKMRRCHFQVARILQVSCMSCCLQCGKTIGEHITVPWCIAAFLKTSNSFSPWWPKLGQTSTCLGMPGMRVTKRYLALRYNRLPLSPGESRDIRVTFSRREVGNLYAVLPFPGGKIVEDPISGGETDARVGAVGVRVV